LKRLRLMTVAWVIRANKVYDRQVASQEVRNNNLLAAPANRGGRGNLIFIKEERHDNFELNAACAGGMCRKADYTWNTELNVA
jgi:hypothetical protein